MTNYIWEVNAFISNYSAIFTFVSFLVGIVGSIVGIYSWLTAQKIMMFREKAIAAHFVNLKKYKQNLANKVRHVPLPGAELDDLNNHFEQLQSSYLQVIDLIFQPSNERLNSWLEMQIIDSNEYDMLIKSRLRN